MGTLVFFKLFLAENLIFRDRPTFSDQDRQEKRQATGYLQILEKMTINSESLNNSECHKKVSLQKNILLLATICKNLEVKHCKN